MESITTMKVLVNDKDIARFFYILAGDLTLRACKDIKLNEFNTAGAINDLIERKKIGKYVPEKDNKKFKDKLVKAIVADAKEYKDKIESLLYLRKRDYIKGIQKNVRVITNRLGEENVLNAYRKSNIPGFTKSVGVQVSKKPKFVRREDYKEYNEDCVVRNTVGNEGFLVTKIDNNYPFWFIDSGYTNFLEGKKKTWHRLVRNHLHHSTMFEAPVDRLGMFSTFPSQWRTGGDIIAVIEPGQFAASIFHIDIKQWKYNVVKELRQYTDKRILFRPKEEKKTRSPLYQILKNDDFYCVVNINSNAATEAVWNGIPVITLDKHITNPISRNKLSDINNLYRPNLSNWLCMLSYSQFTYQELVNGTAIDIVRKYHV
jgi:hypothetical protein